MIKAFFASLLFLTVSAGISSGQIPVNDKNKRQQVEREVFVRWNKFSPAWYYTLFFNKYKKGDKRNMLHLAPTLASLELNSDESQQESKDLTDVQDYHVDQQANTIAESHYYLHFEQVIDKLDDKFNLLFFDCQANEVEEFYLIKFEQEKEMLHEFLKAVREGNVVKGESADAMDQIQQDYRTLLEAMVITADLYKVKKKYLQTQTE